MSLPALTCSSAAPGGRSRSRAAPCAAPARLPDARVLPGGRRRRSCSSSRSASPSGRLVLLAEVAAAGLARGRSASRHMQLGELQEVGHAAGLLERLVELVAARRARVTFVPELLAQLGDLAAAPSCRPASVRAMPHVVPHELARARGGSESTVRLPLIAEQPVDARLRPAASASLNAGVVGRRPSAACVAGEVVADRVGDDEVAVGQALHQRAGAEAVGAVVGEVRLAEHEQAGDGAHQVVVHPQAAHRVVDGGVDAHRHLVRVLAGDPLVHVEQVAVASRRSRPAPRRWMASVKSR